MNTHQLEDETIIAQFGQENSREDNPKLLAELVRRFQKDVVKECSHYVKDKDEAQDVAQEVWIRVITKLHQFDRTKKFRPWLFTIVKNRCLRSSSAEQKTASPGAIPQNCRLDARRNGNRRYR